MGFGERERGWNGCGFEDGSVMLSKGGLGRNIGGWERGWASSVERREGTGKKRS